MEGDTRRIRFLSLEPGYILEKTFPVGESCMQQRFILQAALIHRLLDLLHGYRFCQVARLIDIAAAPYGDVVGKQLQGHHFQDRQKQFRR